MKELRFRYKTIWYNPLKDETTLSDYSPTYKTKEKALDWYNNFGKKLEKMFNRELILIKYEVIVND